MLVDFQFPLWDTLGRNVKRTWVRPSTFNSLYGIPETQWCQAFYTYCFQFPLWDTIQI